MTELAIVTGLVFEAETLNKAAARAGSADSVRIAASGPGRKRARETANALCRDGARMLLSMGIAGGLDPALTSGDAILADAVCSEDGRRLPTDPDARRRLASLLAENGGIETGLLATGHSPAGSRARKRALAQRTGAIAVDMESFGVAEAAHAAGIPFLALRVVADPADQEIPLEALAGLREDGRVNAWPVIRAVLLAPSLMPQLRRLARQNARARARLGRLGEILFAAPGALGL